VLDENSFVTEIDTASQQIVRRRLGHGEIKQPEGLVISPDASTLYVANYRKYVLALSAVSGSLLKSIDVFPSSVPSESRIIGGLSITPNGDFLYALEEDTGKLTMVRTSTKSALCPTSAWHLLRSIRRPLLTVIISVLPRSEQMALAW
jgi:DNA-binding beta-propeller fold protein YncE